jgi:hypothetical protein
MSANSRKVINNPYANPRRLTPTNTPWPPPVTWKTAAPPPPGHHWAMDAHGVVARKNTYNTQGRCTAPPVDNIEPLELPETLEQNINDSDINKSDNNTTNTNTTDNRNRQTNNNKENMGS